MTDHFETLSYVISNLFRIYAMYLFSALLQMLG